MDVWRKNTESVTLTLKILKKSPKLSGRQIKEAFDRAAFNWTKHILRGQAFEDNIEITDGMVLEIKITAGDSKCPIDNFRNMLENLKVISVEHVNS